MRTIEQDNTPTPCAATIGSFDGVHKGHQHVIHQLAAIAHSRQLEAVAVTFANHPLQVLRRDLPVMMLTNAEEKKKLLTESNCPHIYTRDGSHECRDIYDHIPLRQTECQDIAYGI